LWSVQASRPLTREPDYQSANDARPQPLPGHAIVLHQNCHRIPCSLCTGKLHPSCRPAKPPCSAEAAAASLPRGGAAAPDLAPTPTGKRRNRLVAPLSSAALQAPCPYDRKSCSCGDAMAKNSSVLWPPANGGAIAASGPAPIERRDGATNRKKRQGQIASLRSLLSPSHPLPFPNFVFLYSYTDDGHLLDLRQSATITQLVQQ
jgi:hypothetical protein